MKQRGAHPDDLAVADVNAVMGVAGRRFFTPRRDSGPSVPQGEQCADARDKGDGDGDRCECGSGGCSGDGGGGSGEAPGCDAAAEQRAGAAHRQSRARSLAQRRPCGCGCGSAHGRCRGCGCDAAGCALHLRTPFFPCGAPGGEVLAVVENEVVLLLPQPGEGTPGAFLAGVGRAGMRAYPDGIAAGKFLQIAQRE